MLEAFETQAPAHSVEVVEQGMRMLRTAAPSGLTVEVWATGESA